MRNKFVLLVIGIIALVAIIYMISGNKNNEIKETNKVAENNDAVSEKKVEENVSQINQETKNVATEKITLEAVGLYKGSAVATRSFDENKFIHEVDAMIGDPNEGKFYEGWLVKGVSFFSTGKMEKIGDRYVLKYESSKDQSSFNI